MADTRFYIAGRYARRAELAQVADQIERLTGWTSTARWLTGDHQDIGPDDDPDRMRHVAQQDLHDIREADVVFAFTEPPDTPGAARGGRHVELGYAIAHRKVIVTIGPLENVFCSIPHNADTVLEALAIALDQVADRRRRRDALMHSMNITIDEKAINDAIRRDRL